MSFKETSRAAPTRHNPELHEIIVREMKSLARGEVLDLPSGPGYLLKDLRKEGFNGIAGEIDTDLHCFPELKYQQVDMIGQFPFDDARFDFVTSIEGVEHIENHFAFFKEVARILKPGGHLLLTTPNVNTLASRWKFFTSGFHLAAAHPIPTDSPNMYFEHINPIALPNLYFIARRAGLEITKVLTWKFKRASLFWYFALYPLIRLATAHACLPKNLRPELHKENETLYKFLMSRANLCGSHTILIARKVGRSQLR